MKHRLQSGSIVCLVLLASLMAVAPASGSTASLVITSAGPLENIWIGNTLDCQVEHTANPAYQFYAPATSPSDCGTFVTVDGTLYAPDFPSNGVTATGALPPYTAFTPVSQVGVLGAGTLLSPFEIDTTVTAGATGIEILQVDTYVVGNEYYNTVIEVTNNDVVPHGGIVYHAADCYLMGSDSGYAAVGITAPGSIACTENANHMPAGDFQEFEPLTPGSAYYEAGYSSVWAWISGQTMFPDTCLCATFVDNGMGLSWEYYLQPGMTATFELNSRFNGTAVTPLPPRVEARCEAVAVRIVEGDGLGNSLVQDFSRSTAWAPGNFGPPFPPAPPAPAPPVMPNGHGDAEQAGATYGSSSLGVSVDARGIFSQCDVAAWMDPGAGIFETHAYGRAGLGHLTVTHTFLGTLLDLELADFELDARGSPPFTMAAWACDTVDATSTPGKVIGVCPLVAFPAIAGCVAVSVEQPEILGPMGGPALWTYQGAWLHVRLDWSGCLAAGGVLDVYVGYVEVEVTGGPPLPPMYVPNVGCLTLCT